MLTLICGVGRAGKSTYSEQFNNVVHLDIMGVMPERYDNVNKAIADKNDVVVEGIYRWAEKRRKLLEAYKGEGKTCIWLDTPEEIVRERMRKSGFHMTKYHMEFEPPTYDEGWDEIIVLREDNNAER